jgi:hypothetical protein
MQVQATFTLQRQSTGPRASAAGCISMVPYSPADAGIHNPPGEGQTVFDGVVCEQFQAINPEVTPALATLQLTEEIPKLWDPKSDKVIEFAKCVSAAIGLVPGPSPTVEVLGIAFGGVAALEGYHTKALSLSEFGAEGTDLLFQTLGAIAERTGHVRVGFLAEVAAPAAKALVLFVAHEFHKSNSPLEAHRSPTGGHFVWLHPNPTGVWLPTDG